MSKSDWRGLKLYESTQKSVVSATRQALRRQTKEFLLPIVQLVSASPFLALVGCCRKYLVRKTISNEMDTIIYDPCNYVV